MIETGIGSTCCNIVSENTIEFPSEKQVFVLDYAFGPETKQKDVYEKVGKGTILDVINGYNGTIFTYGQTGSGKTYTMFGNDIYSPEEKGIIPRAAEDIFQSWDNRSDAKEVEIRCSMLEIYKEKLRDLMSSEDSGAAADFILKIKESPGRGVYVEGLTETSIASEEELMDCIDQGEEKRVWGATAQNDVSSRSHTLFILQVRQILHDGTEKRGVLNLVDLAGSEKVGKTGAEGKTFEEGTRINLSLSVLGNVIHALTTNAEHVPYRDSKLTMLLRESLAGNYKTTLVVTSTMHSAQMANSISTLKFAQRAKKLQNKVRINIKLSPEQMQRAIEDLREALARKDQEIEHLLHPSESTLRLGVAKRTSVLVFDGVTDPQKDSAGGRTPASEVREATGKRIEDLVNENSRLRSVNQDLTGKLEKSKAVLEAEKATETCLEQRVKELELALEEERAEKRIARLGAKGENVQHKVLAKQIMALTAALEDTQAECLKLLREKRGGLDSDFGEVRSLNVSDLVNREMPTISVLFPIEPRIDEPHNAERHRSIGGQHERLIRLLARTGDSGNRRPNIPPHKEERGWRGLALRPRLGHRQHTSSLFCGIPGLQIGGGAGDRGRPAQCRDHVAKVR